MVIFASNYNDANTKIYIHDYIFNDFSVDRRNKSINISITDDKNLYSKKNLSFLDVIDLNMSLCDFWGSSPHIFDFECIGSGKSSTIKKIFSIKRKEHFDLCPLCDQKMYIEGIMTFTSGDHLRIVCKEIIFEQ